MDRAVRAIAVKPRAFGAPLCGSLVGHRPMCWFFSLQLQHDCAFRDSWSGHTSFASILGDPLPCCPTALVGTSLVLVDRDREPSASGAHEGIAHETLYPPDETFHLSFVLLQEVEKRLHAFARISSNDSMHDTPPRAECCSRERAGTRTIADFYLLHTAKSNGAGDVLTRSMLKAATPGPMIRPRRGHLTLLAGGRRLHLLQAREQAPFRNPAAHIVDGAWQTRRQWPPQSGAPLGIRTRRS